MESVIVLILLLFLLGLLLLWAGMPLGFQAKIHGFIDNYEQLDFEHYGRKITDYCSWKDETVRLSGTGRVVYRLPRWPRLQWIRRRVTCEIIKINVPEALTLELEPEIGPERYTLGYPMSIPFSPEQNGVFTFRITLSPIEYSTIFEKPVEVGFVLRLRYRAPRWLPNSELETLLTYDFLLGPDLGDTWLGIDPGTSGCCIAAASPLQSTVMEQINGEDKITPSLVTFDLEHCPEDFYLEKGQLRDELFEHGEAARAKMLIPNMLTVQSIKKMVGFKNKYQIQFANDRVLVLNGSLLQTALLGRLYRGFSAFIKSEKTRFPGLLDAEKKFVPQRVVITIPNNYTPTQVSELILCMKDSADFAEIRYLAEAEAIACYYLSDAAPREKNDGTVGLNENLLIFDMGGAGINTTVLKIRHGKEASDTQNEKVYKLTTGSKIGYGIGGDTIDYCLLKTFLQFLREPECSEETSIWEINPENNLRNFYHQVARWQQICLELKQIIIQRFQTKQFPLLTDGAGNARALLNLREITDFCERITGEVAVLNEKSKLVRQFVLGENERFSLFDNVFFRRWVYLPVRDAVAEALALSDKVVTGIHTVILAGRSSAFPFISETIMEIVTRSNEKIGYPHPQIYALEARYLKSAVARGACWYGVHNKAVRLAPAVVNMTLGFKQTLSANKKNFTFHTLINAGSKFEYDELGAFATATKALHDDFMFDGHLINFYQIMGSDVRQILQQDEKYKYSRVASIRLPHPAREVSMLIDNKDHLDCRVTTITGQRIEAQNRLAEIEIKEEHEEHYTWMIPD